MTAHITVVGIGGAGCQVVGHMISEGFEGARLVVADADEGCLLMSPCPNKLLIGEKTKPRPFCSVHPEWSRQAALDDENCIRKELCGSDLVCVVAGMGGGVGTGAAQVVIEIAKEMGVFTTAVVTRPFPFEGEKKGRPGRHLRRLKPL